MRKDNLSYERKYSPGKVNIDDRFLSILALIVIILFFLIYATILGIMFILALMLFVIWKFPLYKQGKKLKLNLDKTYANYRLVADQLKRKNEIMIDYLKNYIDNVGDIIRGIVMGRNTNSGDLQNNIFLKIQALVENYPELRADSLFRDAMTSAERSSETIIQDAKELNEKIMDYNQIFVDSMNKVILWFFGLKKAEFMTRYETSNDIPLRY